MLSHGLEDPGGDGLPHHNLTIQGGQGVRRRREIMSPCEGSGGEAWARNDAFSPGYTNGPPLDRPCGRRLALGQQDFYKIVRRTRTET
jgi:hypothetical protein